MINLPYSKLINMEKYWIDRDIRVFYVTATSFPEGVGGAFQKLLLFLPKPNERILYGISFPNERGQIIYKAAVEESFPGEGEQNGYETFLIKKGEYWSELLPDWQKDESIVRKTFQKLLKHPDLDKNGYCLEIYLNEKDVRCLVPLSQ
jgi:predicted transcriptional regulator YdeE